MLRLTDKAESICRLSKKALAQVELTNPCSLFFFWWNYFRWTKNGRLVSKMLFRTVWPRMGLEWTTKFCYSKKVLKFVTQKRETTSLTRLKLKFFRSLAKWPALLGVTVTRLFLPSSRESCYTWWLTCLHQAFCTPMRKKTKPRKKWIEAFTSFNARNH